MIWLNHRPVTIVALLATSITAIAPPAEAGFLCDWLFGHRAAAYYPPYAATYPPAYTAGYTPIAAPAQTAYSMPAQTSYYAPTATATPAPVTSYSPGVDHGAVAAQMPSYAVARPATTAAPLPTGYAGIYSSYYGAAQPAVAAAPSPVTSFYGTGNIYPNNYAANSGIVTANYAAAQAPQAIINPQPHHGLLGGIGRFFGALFGKHHRTSYYRVPVTHYRPVTEVSPVTGAANVVQRPCTSYQYQVQRTPVQSFQLPQTTSSTCGTQGICGTQAPLPAAAPSPSTTMPGTGAPEGYVPQPTLSPDAFDPYASQRQSYPAYSSGTQQYPSSTTDNDPLCPPNNTAPLSGAPPTSYGNGASGYSDGATGYGNGMNGYSNGANGYGNGTLEGATPQDRQTVPQPELDNPPSAIRSYRRLPDSSTSTSGSGWRPSQQSSTSGGSATRARSVRPIPAPQSQWPSPADGDDDAGGRTAAHRTWNSKKIQWASHREPSDVATASSMESLNAPSQTITEPGRQDASQVQRAHLVAEPAESRDSTSDSTWRPVAPRRSIERDDRRPAATPQPQHRERPRYDDSGWK